MNGELLKIKSRGSTQKIKSDCLLKSFWMSKIFGALVETGFQVPLEYI